MFDLHTTHFTVKKLTTSERPSCSPRGDGAKTGTQAWHQSLDPLHQLLMPPQVSRGLVPIRPNPPPNWLSGVPPTFFYHCFSPQSSCFTLCSPHPTSQSLYTPTSTSRMSSQKSPVQAFCHYLLQLKFAWLSPPSRMPFHKAT